MSGEELGKKLDKLLKQSEEQLQKLNSSSKSLRAHVFGQDRYWRRYWELPCSGGIFVEAMESAEPEILILQADLDEKWKDRPIEEIVEEVKKEEEEAEKIDTDNRENEAPNEVKEEKKFNSAEEQPEEDLKPVEEKPKTEVEEINCKKEPVQNSVNEEEAKSPKNEIKMENDTNTMADAKTNVTSEEIKQETEVVNMEVDVKIEEIKKEGEDGDKCDTPKPVVKMMEDKIVETIPNGDKYNHINNLHNGKELNGSFISG